ncbi:hypothetical protein PINS_up016871 [Pythium insidiosum]|nr:hypothetical protein PINS_up016871 [Pythium insidiosum]
MNDCADRMSERSSRHSKHSRHSKSSKHSRKSKRSRRYSDDVSDDDASVQLPCGAPQLSEDDYFLRVAEFRVWLFRRRGKYLEELSSEDAVELFRSKFMRRWNDGKLDRMYYEGIPESVLEQTKRTRHAWGFVKKLSEKERFDLATAKDSVGVATRKSDILVSTRRERERERDDDDEGVRREKRRKLDDIDDRDRDEREHDELRARRRRDRKHHDAVMEELVPRETGREARLEKRREFSGKLHGAARDREANRDGLDLDESFLLGSGGRDDLQRRLAQRAGVRERRELEQRERAAAAAANEAARMDKFLQDMGISTT